MLQFVKLYNSTALKFDIFHPIQTHMSQHQQSISLQIQIPLQQQQKLKQIIKDYEVHYNVSQNRINIYMAVNKTYLHNLIIKREMPKVTNQIKNIIGTNCIIFESIHIPDNQTKLYHQKVGQIKGNIHFILNSPIDLQIKIFLGKKQQLKCSYSWVTLYYKQSGIWQNKTLNQANIEKQESFTFKIAYDSIADLSDPNLLLNASFKRQRQQNYDHLGIINEGNTCYMNSFLQILFYLKPIRKLIVQQKSQNRLILALKKIFIELIDVKQKKPVCIQAFLDNYTKFNQLPRRQQDVQQFLLDFINELEKQFPQLKQFWQGDCTYLVKSKDPQKPYRSSNVQKFSQLDIHMADTKGNFFSDIKQSLQSLIKIEEVEQSIQNQQHGKIQVTKERTIQVLPSILFLNLKRYEYNRQKRRLTKILCPIKYEPFMNFSDLISDITPGSQSYIQDQEYVLYAVIVHKGESPFSGHYFSFINTSENPKKPNWYQFNDSFVQPCDEKTVLQFTGKKNKEIILEKQYQKFTKTQVQSHQSSYLLVYIKFNDFNKFQSTKTKIPHEYIKQKLLKQAQAQKKNITDLQLLILKQDQIPDNFYGNQFDCVTAPLNLEDNVFSQLKKIQQTYLGCKIGTVWKVSKSKKKIMLLHNIHERQTTIKQITIYRRGHIQWDYLLIIPKNFLKLSKNMEEGSLGLLQITTTPQIQEQLDVKKLNLITKSYLQTFQAMIEEKGYTLIYFTDKEDFMQNWNDLVQVQISE